VSSGITSYRDLEVWRRARCLVKPVYVACRSFPKEEVFALTSQTQRAVVSISTNLAEGAGRFGASEFRHFVSIARGSLAELRTLLEIAGDLEYLAASAVKELHVEIDEIDRMLCALHRKLGEAAR
jgi:four helix bundle protein